METAICGAGGVTGVTEGKAPWEAHALAVFVAAIEEIMATMMTTQETTKANTEKITKHGTDFCPAWLVGLAFIGKILILRSIDHFRIGEILG